MQGSGDPWDCTGSRRFRKIYEELRRKMEKGTLASSAMEQTGVFPEMAVNMIRAGEAGGTVQEMAGRLAVHYRKEHRDAAPDPGSAPVSEISGAPVGISGSVGFSRDHAHAGAAAWRNGASAVHPFSHGGQYISEGMVVSGPGFHGPVDSGLGTRGEKTEDPAVSGPSASEASSGWKAPAVGLYLPFAESLSILYASGIPMLTCLETAGRTVGNRYVELQTRFLSERLQNGEALSLAIRDVDGLDRRLALMVLTGEETGKLDVMLKNTADSFEYEADMAVSRLVSLVEPVMILGLGAVIGAILLGIMVPLWRMYGYMG